MSDEPAGRTQQDASKSPAIQPPRAFTVTVSGILSKTFTATAGTTLRELLKDTGTGDKPVSDLSKLSFQDTSGRVVSLDRTLDQSIEVTASRRTSGG